MCIKVGTLMLTMALLFSLTSCEEREKDKTAQEAQIPELFKVVPSDALSIAYSSSTKDILSLTDSLNPLNKINYGKLLKSPAVLAWSYYGELSPMLAIDTGKELPDSMSVASSVISQAQNSGVQCRFYPSKEKGDEWEHGFIVLSPSAAQMKVVERHISERRSILDAPYFPDAGNLIAGKDNILIIRGSGIGRLLPDEFLKGIFSKRSLRSFISSLADWICINKNADESFSVQTVQGDNYSYFTNVLSAQPFLESRIGLILPQNPDFVLSVPIDVSAYRTTYEQYMDASVKMTSYSRTLSSLETETGESPLTWEKAQGVREIALIVYGNSRIVAIRGSKSHEDSQVKDNPCRGFVKALYGTAFATEDSHYKYSRNWMLLGKAEDIEEFSKSIPVEKEEITYSVIKNCHTVIYTSDKTLLWDKKGIKIWNSNQ